MDRNNKQLSLSVIDVDRFKDINDTYGHKKGDLVLNNISDTLMNSIRKGDIVARWGGDEFLVIALESDNMSSLSMMNRIEKELLEISKRMQINISVSIGTSIYPDDGKSLDNLIKVADDKMYENKCKK